MIDKGTDLRVVLNLSTYFSFTPQKFNASLYTLQDQNRGRERPKNKRKKSK